MKRRLIDDWKAAWRWASVRCMAVAASIQGAWLYIPDDMRNLIPHNAAGQITLILLIIGILGRITTLRE